MFDDYVAILDIGTTKIVSMVGRKDSNGVLQILGYGEESSLGVSRGTVSNITEASVVIKKAVSKAKEQSGIDFKEVYVGIAGQHIYNIQNSHSIINKNFDEITEELVQQLIDEVYNMSMTPGDEIIHVFPIEYSVDKQIVQNPIGTMGKQLTGSFHITIGKEKSKKLIERSVEKAGLKCIKTILEPVASAEAVLTADEKEAGVLLVDIGGGTSDMIIYKENSIKFSAVIPFGGNTFTNDIQKGCKILPKDAEEVKRKYGSAVADLVKENQTVTIPGIGGREPKEISLVLISKIIQPRAIEIIDTILYELKNSNFQDEISSGITITGGGALLKDLSQLIDFRTGYETKVSSPINYIYSEKEIFKNPKYSTAIGLLLKGIEYSIQINKHKAEKNKIEEEKRKIEEEKRKIEEEKQKIEEEKRRIEEEKKKEEEEKIEETKSTKKPKKKKNILKKIMGFLVEDEDTEV